MSLDRNIVDLRQHQAEDSGERVQQINAALEVLTDNPLIGRPVGDDRRESLIGRDARGYLALYRYLSVIDTALVLAIPAQRDAGCARP